MTREVSRGVPSAAEDRLRAAFEEHHIRLLRLGLLLTGRPDLAEDLVQDAYVRAARHPDGLAPEVVGAYLRQTLVNAWRNRVRRLVRERRALARHGMPAEEVPATGSGDAAALWTAVRALPPGQRACLVLRYYEDLGERETAGLLGCSVGTVKSQTAKALAHLRREFGDGD